MGRAGGELERLVGLDGKGESVYPDGTFGRHKTGGKPDAAGKMRMRELHVEWLRGRELEEGEGTVVFPEVAAGGFDDVPTAGEAGVGGKLGRRGHGEFEVAVRIEGEERVGEPLEIHRLVAGIGDTADAAHGATGEFDAARDGTGVTGRRVGGAKFQGSNFAEEVPDAGFGQGDVTIDAAEQADAGRKAFVVGPEQPHSGPRAITK